MVAQDFVFKLKVLTEYGGNHDAYFSQVKAAADRVTRDIQTRAASSTNPGRTASRSLSERQGSFLGGIDYAQQIGQIDKELANELRRHVEKIFDSARAEIQQALRAAGHEGVVVKRSPAVVESSRQANVGRQTSDAAEAEAQKAKAKADADAAKVAAQEAKAKAAADAASAAAQRKADADAAKVAAQEARRQQKETERAQKEAEKAQARTTRLNTPADQIAGAYASGDRIDDVRVAALDRVEKTFHELATRLDKNVMLVDEGVRGMFEELVQAEQAASHYQRVLEQSAREAQTLSDLQSTSERGLAAATQDLAAQRRRRQLEESRITLAATSDLVGDEARDRQRRSVRDTEINTELEALYSQEEIEARARLNAMRESRRAREREATATQRSVGDEVDARRAEEAYRDRVRLDKARADVEDPVRPARVAERQVAEEDADRGVRQEAELQRLSGEWRAEQEGTVEALRRFRVRVDDAAAAVQFNELQATQEQLQDATRRLAIARLEQAAEEARLTNTPQGNAAAVAAKAAANELRADRTAAAATSSVLLESEVNLGTQQARLAAATNRERMASEEHTEATAAAALSKRRLRMADGEAQKRLAQRDPTFANATWFQRQQGRLAERQGRFRPATDFQTGGQFLASRAMTTGGFALSGALLYGGVQLMRDVFRESTELQQELAIIESQFDRVDESASGLTFGDFKNEIREIATETGVFADEVARTARQLMGVYTTTDPVTGVSRSDPQRALRDARLIAQASKISGLPQQQAQDDLVAVSLAFQVDGDPRDMRAILDQAAYLENQMGSSTSETLEFSASIAQLAADAGFTSDQLMALGATMSQVSGRGAAGLAENLGRILPAIKENQDVLIEAFGSNDEAMAVLPELATALSQNQMDDVLRLIAQNRNAFTDGEWAQIANDLVGNREAAAFSALVGRRDQLLRALDSDGSGAEGAFEERAQRFAETVKHEFEQVRRELERFGSVLLESGLADSLSDMANVLAAAVSLGTDFLELVVQINDGLGGLPVKAAAFLAIWKVLGSVGGLAGRGIGAAAGRGGLLGDPRAGMFAVDAAGNRVMTRNASRLTASPAFGRGQAGWRDLSWRERANPRNFLASRAPDMMTMSGPMTASQARAGRMAMIGSSALTGAYTLGATLAVERTVSAVQDFHQQVAEQREKMIEEMVTAYTDGLSFELAREKAHKEADSDTRNRSGFQKAIGFFGMGPQGNGKAEADVELALAALSDGSLSDALNEIAQEITDEQYRSVSDELKKQLSSLENVRGKYVSAASTMDAGDVPVEWLKNAEAYKLVEGAGTPEELVKNLVEQLEKDPTNENLQQLLVVLRDTLSEDPALDRILAAYDSRRTREIESGKLVEAEEKRQAKYDTQIDLLQKKISAGQGSRAELQTLLARKKASLVAFTQGELTDEDLAVYMGQILDVEEVARQDILAGINESNAVWASLGGAGVGTPQSQLDAALANFARLSTGAISTEDRFAEAVKIRGLRQAVLDYQLEAAKSEGEKLKILEADAKAASRPEDRALVAQQIKIAPGLIDLASKLNKYKNEDGSAKEADQIVDMLTEVAFKNGELDQAAFDAELDHMQKMLAAQLAALDQRIGLLSELAAPSEGLTKRLEALQEDRARINGLLQEAFRIQAEMPDLLEIGGAEGESKYDEERKKIQRGIEDAESELRRSMLAPGDEIGSLRIDMDRALRDRARAWADGESAAVIEAQARINEVQKSIGEALRAQAQGVARAQLAVQKALADGDPMRLANIQMQEAQLQMAYARLPEEIALANAAIIDARNSQRDAVNEIADAFSEIVSARLSNDQLGSARFDVSLADRALANARGEADRYRAMAAQVEAKRALDEAMMVLFEAQADLASALAESNGNTVEVARNAVKVAEERLRRAKAGGAGQSEIATMQAALVRSQTALTTESRNDRIGDLDYLYEFDRITASRYIELLRSELMRIPESNKNARREIERKIKALREEMSSDLQFNLPGELKLPTLYEIRRADQAGQMGGGGSYQDNRIVTVNVNQANDPAGVVNAVTDALGRPPVSTGPGLY